jgi:ribosomal protein S18 acetylase RimI-like enzyme
LGFGAFAGNKIIGAAWLRLLTGDNKGYGYWSDDTPELTIALAPDFRGQGIGTQLLQTLLEAAATRFRAVSLSVEKSNPARRLYERFGFEIVEYDATSLLMLKQFLP